MTTKADLPAIRALAAMHLKGEAVEGEPAVITMQQTEEADCNLSPSRWADDSGRAGATNPGERSDLQERLRDDEKRLDAELAPDFARLRKLS